MWTIYRKELASFFSSVTGYLVISLFLIILGLFMWVFPDSSLLEYNYASLNQLFDLSPFIFMFLIPAVCMRSISEELQAGTMEFLATKPLEDWKIVAGKFLAALSLVAFALLPTTLYIYTVYQLGAPVGNIDTGAVGASYFGLFLLASAYVSLGLFASSLTKNQIVAFLLAVLFCFVFYLSFLYLSKLPVFLGKFDDIVQKIGIEYHYVSMSRGLIDSRDIIYFLGFIFFFLLSTQVSLSSRRW